MKARDLAYETASALDANRGRSVLTVLGIVIGIAAVIAMTALIGGVKQSLVSQLGLGSARVVYIYDYSESRPLTTDDLPNLLQGLPGYEYMTGTVDLSADVTGTAGKKNESAWVTGAEPVYFDMTNAKFVQGRNFTQQEAASGASVCIVSQGSLKSLFGKADAQAVGQSVKVGNDVYAVVGVTEASGYDDMVQVTVPLVAASERMQGSKSLSQVLGYAREDVDMDSLVSQTQSYVTSYLGLQQEQSEDGETYSDVYVMSTKSIMDEMNATMSSFQILMTAVASVSLLVGGIGIMNMMLTNVTERIREIGLRKALGARRSDITMQFLLESVTLCLIGGILGVLVGYLGAFALSGLASGVLGSGATITPAIDAGAVLLATGICIGIGVLFGFYPARRAAKLDPVESLRYQ